MAAFLDEKREGRQTRRKALPYVSLAICAYTLADAANNPLVWDIAQTNRRYTNTGRLDVIDEVGPGGEFISTAHTVRHFREHWYPGMFDRNHYDGWTAKGSPAACEKANGRAREIIEGFKGEPLPENVLSELDRMERTWKAGLTD